MLEDRRNYHYFLEDPTALSYASLLNPHPEFLPDCLREGGVSCEIAADSSSARAWMYKDSVVHLSGSKIPACQRGNFLCVVTTTLYEETLLRK